MLKLLIKIILLYCLLSISQSRHHSRRRVTSRRSSRPRLSRRHSRHRNIRKYISIGDRNHDVYKDLRTTFENYDLKRRRSESNNFNFTNQQHNAHVQYVNQTGLDNYQVNLELMTLYALDYRLNKHYLENGFTPGSKSFMSRVSKDVFVAKIFELRKALASKPKPVLTVNLVTDLTRSWQPSHTAEVIYNTCASAHNTQTQPTKLKVDISNSIKYMTNINLKIKINQPYCKNFIGSKNCPFELSIYLDDIKINKKKVESNCRAEPLEMWNLYEHREFAVSLVYFSLEEICAEGYKYLFSTNRCVNINECRSTNGCNKRISKCIDTIGNYQCVCKKPTNTRKDRFCSDKNECKHNPCGRELGVFEGSILTFLTRCKHTLPICKYTYLEALFLHNAKIR